MKPVSMIKFGSSVHHGSADATMIDTKTKKWIEVYYDDEKEAFLIIDNKNPNEKMKTVVFQSNVQWVRFALEEKAVAGVKKSRGSSN